MESVVRDIGDVSKLAADKKDTVKFQVHSAELHRRPYDRRLEDAPAILARWCGVLAPACRSLGFAIMALWR